MTSIRISRRLAVAVACMVTVLAAPSGATALTTHSATTSTVNSNGQLVATAKCGAGEHVVSGGYSSSVNSAAVVSRAVHRDSWTVNLFPGNTDTLTTYAYCARKGQLSISQHGANVTAATGFANTTVSAGCASGEKIVAGGYAFTPTSDANSSTYRDYAASTRKWTVMSVFNTTPANLAAFAYCSPGVVVKVRSASTTIPDGFSTPANGSATVRCHAGETLLAGGYTTTPTPDYFNNTGPDFFYSGSHRSGTRSWTARATNYSKVSGTLTVFAYCTP